MVELSEGLDQGLCWNPGAGITEAHKKSLLGQPRTGPPLQPPSHPHPGRYPYAPCNARMPRPLFQAPTLIQTPGDRSHKDLHLRAHLNRLHIPLARPSSQGTRSQTRLYAIATGATPVVRAQRSRQARKQRFQCGYPARTSTSQRPGSPTAQLPKGSPQRPAADSSRVGRRPGKAQIPAGRGPLKPVPTGPLALRPGEARARRRAVAGGPEPESPLPSPHLSFPRREALPAPNGKAPLPARRDALRRRDELGAPDRAQRGDKARRSRPPGCRPPGPRQRREPGSSPAGHARWASLPVKVSPGPSGRTRSGRGGGGRRRGDLTPSLREDGHRAAPSWSPTLPSSAEVPFRGPHSGRGGGGNGGSG